MFNYVILLRCEFNLAGLCVCIPVAESQGINDKPANVYKFIEKAKRISLPWLWKVKTKKF